MKQNQNNYQNLQNEQAQQEFIFRLSVLEEQIQQLQQQLQIIEQNIINSQSLMLGLDELKNSAGKEVFSPVGGGIFVKTKVLSDDLIVNVGKGNFVKKSIAETKKLIEKQIKKLDDVKKEVNDNIEKINAELEKLMKDAQKGLEKKEKQ